jgi:hypothetical protein
VLAESGRACWPDPASIRADLSSLGGDFPRLQGPHTDGLARPGTVCRRFGASLCRGRAGVRRRDFSSHSAADSWVRPSAAASALTRLTRSMPPKTPHDAQEAEQSGKRARKSVERLSSSQMQAKQYSAHALGVSLGALYGCAPDEEQVCTLPVEVLIRAGAPAPLIGACWWCWQAASACVAAGSSLETLICIRCKRADHEVRVLRCPARFVPAEAMLGCFHDIIVQDKMLLCDLCDKGWHLFCLNPPLQVIPVYSAAMDLGGCVLEASVARRRLIVGTCGGCRDGDSTMRPHAALQ